jgi:hypothetical protein
LFFFQNDDFLGIFSKKTFMEIIELSFCIFVNLKKEGLKKSRNLGRKKNEKKNQ